jgi:hypothetical protein
MIGRRSIVGLALLSVFAFCAFAAQGASAAWETATDTTAFTCVKGGGSLDFKDPDCTEPTTAGKGEYGHVKIGNEKTLIESSSSASSVLTGELLGAKVVITCKKTVPDAAAVNPNEPFIENTETKEPATMDLHGTSAVVFEECSVTGNGPKCTVPSITLKTLFKGVKEPVTGNMAVQFEKDGQEFFVNIKFTGTCLVPEAKVKGIARGTVNGAYLEFKAEDEELTFAENPATFTGKFTTKMVGGNAISITTT